VKPSTAHYPKHHSFVKTKKKEKSEGEGTPAPEKPSLSHLYYGNTTEMRCGRGFGKFFVVEG